ncbi:MAG: zinc-dependent metalloprotease [Chitinophagales bacterium]
MKSILITLLAVFVSLLPAQENTFQAPCLYDQLEAEFKAEEPEAYALYQLAHQRAAAELAVKQQSKRSTPATASCPDGIRIIPLYIHILHNGGNANVAGDNNFTTAEIQTAIDQLNMHYQGTHPNLNRVQDQFWANGSASANTCIQFCWNNNDLNRVNLNMAPFNATVIDPNNRIISGQDMVASPIKNRCQYLNLYIGNYGIGIAGGGLLGYARNLFHSGVGVRIDDNAFIPGGLITNPIVNLGTTLTHEIGHLLGLSHIWGKTNIANWNLLTPATFCGIDDGFSDTPLHGRPSSGPGAGVPNYVQNEVVTHCGNTIMWTNFMDYSSKPWTVNFTHEQVAYMKLYLKQAENLLPFANNLNPPCNSTGGVLNGESKCNQGALACAALLINIPHDTLRICGTDTINLNQYTQNWNYNTNVSPTTEYSWHIGSLTGPLVEFPAKAVVSGNSPICKPDTIEYWLNINCSTSGTKQMGGKVVVLSYLTPEQLLARYLKNGDCDTGPGPEFSAADLAANCDDYITFTPHSNPTFPTTVSGEIVYTVDFDSTVVGPCCSQPCSRIDTAQYRCEMTPGQCPGVAFSGGNMNVLTPCPDYNFEDGFQYYENTLISLFDPNGYVNDIYYFSDPERSVPFDENRDYTYDGDGCGFGSNVFIYTSLGCDTSGNGVPNGYIPLGTVTLHDPAPFPEAPSISYIINGDMDCIYEIVPACPLDDVTPNPLPVETCGSTGSDISFSVLSFFDCEKSFVVKKPDCPACTPQNECVSSTFTGGSESICSGSTLSGGFPDLGISDASLFSEIIWTDRPIEMQGVNTYPEEPDDLPGYNGPTLNSNPSTGLPETQVYFAYAICDHDNDPSTPAVYQMLGGYEITIEPVPDARITPVCLNNDSQNFYIEIELHSNAQSNTFTATNDYNADFVSFNAPGTKTLGPFPNGTDIIVDFAIDGGCSISKTFNTGCTSAYCSTPELNYTDTCILNSANNQTEYWIKGSITGNTIGYLFEITNNVSNDTFYASMNEPNVYIGPFPSSQNVEVTATNYGNRQCFSTDEIIPVSECSANNIDLPEQSEIKIYPNPADGYINIEIPSEVAAIPITIQLFDVIGKELAQHLMEKGEKTISIPLTDFSSGIYLMRISAQENQKYNQVLRFVKR